MKNKESNSLFIIMLIITIILGVYLIISIYFTKHFYIGTYINGINVSCKTLNEANDKLLEESYNYVLELSERIRALRAETGLTRKQFAEHFQIPLRTVEEWEAGRRKPPEYIPRLLKYQIMYEQQFDKQFKGDENKDNV